MPLLDLIRYLGAAVLLVLAGVGLTTLMRLPATVTVRLLVGAAFGHAVWAIVLGLAAVARLRIASIAPALWVLTAILAAIGVRALSRRRPSLQDCALAASGLALPLVVMAPWFLHGLAEYPGSGLPDGWAYVAYGQYLWDYPRGAEGGLPPLYQYASTLSETRHVASAELGLLAALQAPGDVQRGAGLLQALALASYALGCLAFARRAGASRLIALSAAIVATMSGWTLNVLWANNHDNLIALALAPALAMLAVWPHLDRPGWWIGIALLSSALLHVYPELALPLLACAGATVLSSAGRRGATTRRRVSWRMAALGAAVVLIAAGPAVPHISRFARNQAQVIASPAAERAGAGSFTGLLDVRHVLAGWWGLGSEHAYARALTLRTLLALALTGCLIAGAVVMVRERRARALWFLAPPFVLAPILAAPPGYGYGAYKAILIGWWMIAFLAVRGAAALATLLTARAGLLGAAPWLIVAVVPLVAVARLTLAPVSRSFRMPRPPSMAWFRQIESVRDIVGNDAVLLDVRDEEACEWAMYYLRRQPMQLISDHRYLRPKAATMARAAHVPPAGLRWRITDASRTADPGDGPSRLRVRTGPYSLWEIGR